MIPTVFRTSTPFALRTLLATACLLLLLPFAEAQAGDGMRTTRADLIGVWRLLRIEREGPDGVGD
jgi:hypothetical protein